MTNSAPENDLENRASVFKALGHPVRLLIMNLILAKPRHGEELAMILNLNPATISHHLGLLSSAGLLSTQKDQYYQTYSATTTVLENKLIDMIRIHQPELAPGVKADAFREKVLLTFFKRGRLIKIPAQLKKQQVILEKIAQEFEPGREYTEREVNIILLDFHDDVASLRRGLIEHGLMEHDHGLYWRKADH